MTVERGVVTFFMAKKGAVTFFHRKKGSTEFFSAKKVFFPREKGGAEFFTRGKIPQTRPKYLVILDGPLHRQLILHWTELKGQVRPIETLALLIFLLFRNTMLFTRT